MFERYSQEAKRVIFFARFEAGGLGSPNISGEHILLGLLKQDPELIGRFLPDSDFDPDRLRETVTARIAAGTAISTRVEMPLSEEAARILGRAVQEANQAQSRSIETEHLLRALVWVRDGAASVILREIGLDFGGE